MNGKYPKLRTMKNSILILLLAVTLVLNTGAQKALLTVAEQSGFESTSNEADVLSFLERLTTRSGIARLESMAVSVEGRTVPLLVIASPMPKSPAALKKDGRMVVYIQANIHAGEVEGKEAALMLARDLVTGSKKDILRHLVVLICPNFNPDGNEAISPLNRAYQNGPKNGVGVRHNGQMLDLNRDGMKLESPEVTGLVGNVFNKWDPAVTVDCHTTNGSYHDEPVTFTWMMNPAGDRSLINYMRDKMMPVVSEQLHDKYGVLNCYYGEFTNPFDTSLQWISYASEPRYLVNYIGLRNRLAILNENYVYADFGSRVMGCYFLLHSILDYTVDHKREIQELLEEADQRTITRGLVPTGRDSFPIEYVVRPTPEKVTIHTYEVTAMTDSIGRPRMVKSDRKKVVTIPYLADYYPSRSVPIPYAYLMTVHDPEIIRLLKSHGIQLEKLVHPLTAEVESFRLTELKPSSRLNQGHYENSVSGSYVKETREFKPGTCVIRMAQPLASLAAYLMEPQSNDGLLLWNFFDRYLVPQWGRGLNPYPVYKLLQKTDMATEKSN